MQFYEEITNLFDNVERDKNRLNKIKLYTMRSMIINKKPIPLKSILKTNYSNFINNSLKSPRNISYAID